MGWNPTIQYYKGRLPCYVVRHISGTRVVIRALTNFRHNTLNGVHIVKCGDEFEAYTRLLLQHDKRGCVWNGGKVRAPARSGWRLNAVIAATVTLE